MAVNALPVTYNGITYRSALEADWAATFDSFGWYFEYEAHPVLLDGGGAYLCDFHLPGQNVWAEAKGPHNDRIDKTHRLYRALREDAEKPGGELVIILRAADGRGSANWHHVVGPSFAVTINHCGLCDNWCFTQPAVDGTHCRACQTPNTLTASHSYISAVAAERMERGLTAERLRRGGIAPTRDDLDAALAEQFGHYGRLPFVRAPRQQFTRSK